MSNSKKTILDVLLDKVDSEETTFTVPFNCDQPDNPVRIKGLKVVYPEAAKAENCLTLSGGCVAKISLDSDLDELISSPDRSKLNELIERQVQDTKKGFDGALSQFDDDIKSSYDYYNQTVKIILNQILINRIEDVKPPGIPDFRIALTKVENNSLSDLITIDSHESFSENLSSSKTRLPNTHSIFKFKFISVESLLEITSRLKDRVTNISGIQARSWDGSLVSEYNEKLASIVSGELTDKEEIEGAIKSIIGYIFPILNVDVDVLKSESDNNASFGFYTIIKDEVYFRFPNFSGDTIEGSNNFYGLGEDDVDGESNVRSESNYMSMEIINTNIEYSFIPLKYIPPPSVKSFSYLISPDENGIYQIELDKDGFIGGNSYPFGVSATAFEDYKFVLSPLKKDLKSNFKLKGALKDLKNNLEYIEFPGQKYPEAERSAILLSEVVPDKSDSKKLAARYFEEFINSRDPDNPGDGLLFLGNRYSEIQNFSSESDDEIRKDNLQNRFGIQPELLPNSIVSRESLISMNSRYDVPLDLSGGEGIRRTFFGKNKPFKRNADKIYLPSVYTQDPVMVSYAPKLADFENIKYDIYFKKSGNQFNLTESLVDQEDGDLSSVYLQFSSADIKTKYNYEEQIAFNLYVVDKFGQYTKVYEPKAGHFIFQDSEPSVSNYSLSGEPLRNSTLESKPVIELIGDRIGDATKIIIEAFEQGPEESPTAVNVLFEFPANTQPQRRGVNFIYKNVVEKVRNKITITVKRLFPDGLEEETDDMREAFGFDVRTKLKIRLFQGDEELESVKFTIRLDKNARKEDEERKVRLKPNSIKPRGISGGKFYDIPITNDPSNQPQLRVKVNRSVFKNSQEIFCYLGAPVSFWQTEQEIGDEFKKFCFDEDLIEANFDDPKISSVEGGYNERKFIICKSVKFTTKGSILARSSRKASIPFPGVDNAYKNFEGLVNLKSCILFFSTKDLEQISKKEISLTEDILNSEDEDTYSVIPIGQTEGGVPLRPFIFPPRIYHIGAVRNSRATTLTTEEISFKTNTFFNQEIINIYKDLRRDKSVDSGFKDFIGPEGRDFSRLGESLYLDKKNQYFVVIFDAGSDESDIRKYRMSIGSPKIPAIAGLFGIGRSKRVFKKIIKGKGVLIFKTLKVKQEGYLDVKIKRKDRRFRISYNSDLIKAYDFNYLNNPSFITINEDTGGVKIREAIQYDKEQKVVNILENNYFPLRTEIQKSRPEPQVGLFTNGISVTPNVNLTFFGVPSSKSGENNSDIIPLEDADRVFAQEQLVITVDPNGNVVLEEEFYDKLQKNIDNIIQSLDGAEPSEDFLKSIEKDSAMGQVFQNNIGELKDKVSNLPDAETSGIEALSSIRDILSTTQSLSASLELSPFSGISDFLQNGIDNIDELVDSLNYSNSFVALEDKIAIPQGSEFSSGKVNIKKDESEVKLSFFIKYDGYSQIRALIPRVVGYIIGNIGDNAFIKPISDLKTILPSVYYQIVFENFDPRKSKIELNLVEIVEKKKDRIVFLLNEDSRPLLNLINKIASPLDDQNCLKLSITTDNSPWWGSIVGIGREFSNMVGRAKKSLLIDDNEIFKLENGPANPKTLIDEKIKSFCDDTSLDFIGDKICGGGLKNTIKSFCDFSFHATIELSLELKSFKKLLVVIKVIFCIIDVLCALSNPKKLAFALIRLFICLYDLLLLLPQISVPVMYLKLLLHFLSLIICVIDKILYGFEAVNNILEAIEIALENKNVASVKNLQVVLDKYLVTIEADLNIMQPILDVLQIFIELLDVFVQFPCRISEGDDLSILCLEPSNLVGIIATKVAPKGAVEPDFLLPVIQNYTTIEAEGAKCGNTPSPDLDNSDSKTFIVGGDNCDFGSGVVKTPEEHYGQPVLTKTNDQSFNDVAIVVTDEERFQRIKNSSSIEPTYAVSYTKSKKRRFSPLGSGGLLVGPDPRRVEFLFNNKSESYGFANWVFSKKYIDISTTMDSPFKLLKKNNKNELSVSDSGEIGDFVSFTTGYSKYLREEPSGNYSVTNLEIEFTSIDGSVLRQTSDTIPSLAIMDENFNIYFIEENGIEVDSENRINKIIAVNVNKISADTYSFSKEASNVPKEGSDGVAFREHSNYEYVLSLGKWSFPSDDNTTYSLNHSGIGLTAAEKSAAPYPAEKAKNYATGDVDDTTELQNAIDSQEIFSFPNLYFIDMRQFQDEITQACQTGVTDIFGAMEITDNTSSEIVASVKDQIDCVQKFSDIINSKLNGLDSEIQEGKTKFTRFSQDEIKAAYEELEGCTQQNIAFICKYVFNPLNTSFKLIGDTDETDRDDAVNPSEFDDDIFFEAAGFPESFPLPEIIGAEEYASGIGDNIISKVNKSVFVEVIPRDSYNNIIPGDLSNRVVVRITKDTTGAASIFGPIGAGSAEGSYLFEVKSSKSGLVDIAAFVCERSIKAFGYKGFVSQDQVSDECIQNVSVGVGSPIGSIIRVDRILNIEFVDDGPLILANDNGNAGFEGNTKPQKIATKLEN